jgi:hypothetical protein
MMCNTESSQKKRRLNPPVYEVFSRPVNVLEKNSSTTVVCARLLHSYPHRLMALRWKWKPEGRKKQWQGSPKEIQTFHQGLFLPTLRRKETAQTWSTLLRWGFKFATSTKLFATGSYRTRKVRYASIANIVGVI